MQNAKNRSILFKLEVDKLPPSFRKRFSSGALLWSWSTVSMNAERKSVSFTVFMQQEFFSFFSIRNASRGSSLRLRLMRRIVICPKSFCRSTVLGVVSIIIQEREREVEVTDLKPTSNKTRLEKLLEALRRRQWTLSFSYCLVQRCRAHVILHCRLHFRFMRYIHLDYRKLVKSILPKSIHRYCFCIPKSPKAERYCKPR